MSEEKKVLTPEEISNQVRMLWAIYWQDKGPHGDTVEDIIKKLIREYGEQQYQKGKDDEYYENRLAIGGSIE